VIRTVLMLIFWCISLPLVALFCFPWTILTGDIGLLYRVCMWGASAGVRLAGVRVQTHGLEKIDPSRTYIYMSNHASNIDPPLMLPLIPGRTSVMVKKELFSVPILNQVMVLGRLVPVDRKNRDAGIRAVRAATEVVRQGITMTIYVEGGRSFDGRLLPFKKGPFYLAEACQVPVVPVTIAGSHYVMPKRRFAIKPGKVDVIFHDAIEPADFGDRDSLMEKVRRAINRGLPAELQHAPSPIAESGAPSGELEEGTASA